ncbi:hypothetical protein O1611_g1324 [Lasiodiplodia mahajangana]|uniref:Uncharacterized protein n=1 Tax=Lasiodiplodia mahajangana TaxID=1108764 RepID=A0ACC2JXV1_9PEZI|nr:hypothetical protein O1611_g1324 [Lasiodiplodia mahajangana]
MERFLNAIQDNDLQSVKFFVSNGVDIDGHEGQALILATQNNNFEMVKFLIDNRADPNKIRLHSSPLFIAVREGNLDLVKFLVENGADVNLNGIWSTPFHEAVKRENLEVIKFLVQSGADINNGWYRDNPLHIAARKGNLETVKFLVENGANINKGGYYGSSLHAAVAAEQQLPEVVEFLIRNGSDINLRDMYQRTPLHLAVNQQSSSILRLLLENEARPDAKDDTGTTPFDLAVQVQNKELVQLLLSKMEPPPLLSARDWRSALRVEPTTGLRFTFGKFLSVDVLNSSRSLDLTSEHIDRFAFDLTGAPSRDLLNQNHDVLDGCAFEGLSRFTFDTRWWRRYIRERNVHPLSRRIVDQDQRREWVLEPSPMPNLGLRGQLEYGEWFIESWFVVSCPAITNREWPVPQALTAGSNDDIEQLEGFCWITKFQSSPDNTHNGTIEDSWRLTHSFSTVDDCPVGRIQDMGDLVIPLIDKLGRTFGENHAQVSRRLSRSRLDVLLSGGGNPRLLQRLISDATMIEHMAENYGNIVRSLTNLLDSCGSLQPGPWRLAGSSLQDSRRRVENLATHGEGLRMLLERSQSIIQLEFNLTSILEAQRSTTTNRSLKRLTWVTFAYLPLLFVASLFGMNVDILKDNPSLGWYFLFAVIFTLLTFAAWIIFKRFNTLEGNLEKYFERWFGKDPETDVEMGHVNNIHHTIAASSSPPSISSDGTRNEIY